MTSDQIETAQIEADEHPGGLARVVARGARFAGAGYVALQTITFGTYLVLAKLMVPSDFGEFAAATIVVGLGMLVGESGMLAALIQRRDGLDEALNSAFLATLAGGLLLSLLALAVAPVIGLVFHSEKTGVVAAAMSGWMLLRLATVVPDAFLQRRFSFVRRVIVDPLGGVAFAVGTILPAASGMGVWALVIGTYAQAGTNVAAAWALAGWRPKPRRATVRMWRDLARYGRPVVVAEFIRRVTAEVPVVVVGRFIGAGPLGQLTYASRVAAQPLGVLVNVGGYVLLPALASIASQEERFREAVVRSLRWVCVLAFSRRTHPRPARGSSCRSRVR